MKIQSSKPACPAGRLKIQNLAGRSLGLGTIIREDETGLVYH